LKALIIDEPWISKILRGEKTWEMRSRRTELLGWIALVRKGSGQIVGVAELTGCQGPLTLERLRAGSDRHCIPMPRYESGELGKWNVAWLLRGARPLPHPVPYQHPSGAVIWVSLSDAESIAVEAALEDLNIHLPSSGLASRLLSTTVPEGAGARKTNAPAGRFALPPTMLLPVARDGTWFHPGLIRRGEFTVGEKGDEQRFDNFVEALEALKGMTVPKWRRPNDVGNWGIVSGIRWETAHRLDISG
jgi:hypothetical protein